MSQQSLVIFSGNVSGKPTDSTTRDDLGGKTAALASLDRIGVPVPKWFCIPASAFAAAHANVSATITASEGSDAIAGSSRSRARDIAERARAQARAASLDDSIRDMVLRAFDRTFASGERVAVRSSAVGEDSQLDSFAGQLDTFLYVSREDLLERVAECVASAYTERAIVYRERRGLGSSPVRVAVIVQQMIDSRASGVLFTANPTTCNRDEAVISAGLGLGEGIVAGRVETDTFLVDLASATITHRTIVDKRSRIVFDGKSSTKLEDVDGDEATVAAITDGEASRLVTMARGIQDHFGRPQDIEWAVDPKGAIHILQARPITTLERETIFDSSNIVESFPGISSPLTFSFARRSYEEAFREAQLRTGNPRAAIDANRHVHANLISLVNGRIYYNILNWYRLYTWVPGFEGLLSAWEKALGITARFTQPPDRAPRTLAVRFGQARVIEACLRSYLSLQRDVDAYLALLTRVQSDVRSRDLDGLEAHELVELLQSVTVQLLRPYSVSVINDAVAQQLYEALARLIASWKLGDPTTLRNELLCGERGVESVAPARALVNIANRVRSAPKLAAAFAAHDDAALAARLARDPDLAPLKEAIDEHLRVYGDRTIEELKLETTPLHERPDFLLAMIRNYVRGRQDVASMESHEAQIRARAEEQVADALSGHAARRKIFDFVVGGARRTVRNRENLRLARSRAYGIVRSIYRAMSRRFVAKGLLALDADIFFLTVEEVESAVRGSSATRDLRALVALRRSEYEGFARMRPAPRITVRGIVHAAELDEAPSADPRGPVTSLLRGIACSPGRHTATAKVVLHPEHEVEVHGEILVAPMTDPAWVYLMVAAGGLVAERGSVLSHTAIIGRELGIPTVVGVAGATEAIASGQTIEIDGAAGTVRILAPTEGPGLAS